ncbi:hypothetical protein HYT54_00530 [Candidatus Woesearchaeota archaeon]|nr:hypothetical protein [Candidatus Woesearchaeota archaeon]
MIGCSQKQEQISKETNQISLPKDTPKQIAPKEEQKNLSDELPFDCNLNTGIQCLEYDVKPDYIRLLLRNTLGTEISLSEISIGNCKSKLDRQFKADDLTNIELSGCTNGKTGDKFSSDIILKYAALDESGNEKEHIAMGKLITEVG